MNSLVFPHVAAARTRTESETREQISASRAAGTLRGLAGPDSSLILNVWLIFDGKGIQIGKSYEPYVGKGARFHAARDAQDEYERLVYSTTIELLPNGMWREISV